jgi:putative tryptophan/tyrosine transport system substrate-binding protein
MGFDNDPIGSGFVASLARPGGNITGLSSLAPEISGKQLELLKEIVPRLSRVAILGTSITPATAQRLNEIERSAEVLKVHVPILDIQSPKDIENAFRDRHRRRADAMLV